MSRAQRLGLVALAAVIAVAAVLIVAGGDDDEDAGSPTAGTAGETGTVEAAPEPPEPVVPKVRLRGHAPTGGVKEIRAAKGDTVRFLVISDAADEVHLHGYGIIRAAAPGKPARFVFTARIEGIFELESHEAEHAGKDPLVAKLRVEP